MVGAIGMEQAWLIPALPALAFVVVALLNFFTPYGKHGDKLAILAMFLSWLLFFPVAHDLLKHHDLFTQASALARINTSGFDWMKFGGVPYLKALGQDIYSLRIGFFVDQITLVMLGVVTFVALMVQVYSLGYMKGEVRYGWFFAVLSLFTAAMLTLVLADNFLLLYVCWEGVGICSYLLIGHYYERRSAAEAAKKAFITTRLGDVMLLIGIVLLWRQTGTFDMREIFHHAEAGDISKWYLTMSTLFLFGGAVGKSAQFPLHVWLPDAMEGPTPVSALIHAATMVVAGVYLVARIMPLFVASSDIALYVVITLGMITTVMAACMGLVMTDIKRVVAYSTLNSLGLMMVSLGFGPAGVAPAMLYLLTHAFFKALVFLGSGSVIHATENQEVDHLGGLKEKMPITHATYFIGMLAMAGLFPLSGYWAKDEILAAARHYTEPGNIVILVILLASLPLTAAYMYRVYTLTFQGTPRDHHAFEHAHESPPVMSWPLIALAALAAVSGFVVLEPVGKAIGFGSGFLGLISSVIEEPEKFKFDVLIFALSVGAVVAGLAWARSFWAQGLEADAALEARMPTLYRIFKNKFYVDDFYQWLINHVFLALARFIAYFDRTVVNDTGVNGAGQIGLGLGWFLKYFQTGKLPNYALFMAVGITVVALVGYSVR